MAKSIESVLFSGKNKNHRQLRTDEHSWCKYQSAKSKRASMTHVVEVQHTKEQNAKGLELLGLGIACEEFVVVNLIDSDSG